MTSIDTRPCVKSTQNIHSETKVRFATLDSWRGLCALLVAAMHFPASGAISESLLVRNAFLFVDYFFVLSGFVIAHGYASRVDNRLDFLRFGIVRFGRIYPLHFVVLLMFAAYEGLRWVSPMLRGSGAAFSSGNSLPELLSSLALLNSMGVDSQLSWNGPSWSISAEFWTYLLFAVALLSLGRRTWLALVAMVLFCPVILYLFSPKMMDATWNFGFVRCVYGFSAGALLYWLLGPALMRSHKRWAKEKSPTQTALWTMAESLAVVAVAAFVALFARDAIGIAAPLLFAVALFVFGHERGAISRVLRTRLFLWLGALSYGIYMLHIFIQSRMINAATLYEKISGTPLIGTFVMNGEEYFGFGVNGAFFGTAMLILMLVVVIAAAFVAHHLIELPFLNRSRKMAAALSEPPEPVTIPVHSHRFRLGA